MAGPGEEIAVGAGGRSDLRASHADREQVIGALKAAFVQGMLAKDEFDLRVGHTFASRTQAELAALTADLPAAQPPSPPLPRASGEFCGPGLADCCEPSDHRPTTRRGTDRSHDAPTVARASTAVPFGPFCPLWR